MIREATIQDRFALVMMGRRFAEEAPGPWKFDAAAAERTVKEYVADPTKLALVATVDGAPVGMLLAHMGVHPFTGSAFADELVLWVDPAHRGRLGIKLMTAYEDWAWNMGAVMVGLADYTGRAGPFYARRGYAPIETHYARMVI